MSERTHRASVIIPAHNEEQVIDRCLTTLLTGVDPEDFEVIVAANGCSDRTVERARRHPVEVLELAEASKPAALNRGDALATAFPRVFLDADVELSGRSLEALAEAMREDGPPAGAPRYHFVTTERPWLVQAYYRIWTRLPYAADRPLGSGIFALTHRGRERFDAFPDAIADDLYVRSLFPAADRHVVNGSEVVVHTARRTRSLIRRCTRTFSGNAELRERGLLGAAPPTPGRRALLGVVRREPRLLLDVPAYLLITATAKVLARRRRGARGGRWDRDDSSRDAPTSVREL